MEYLSAESELAPAWKGCTVCLYGREHMLQTDRDLADALQTQEFVSLRQEHGGTAVIIREASQRTIAADAAATDRTGLTLAIRAADCQIFAVYCIKPRICGVVHAGWKGLKAGIIPSFCKTIQQEWHADLHTAQVIAGPSLCTGCAEFTDPHTELDGLNAAHFHGRNADLRSIADGQWAAAGIRPKHIIRHPSCTRCEHDRYWSYRGGDRDRVREGCGNVLACRLREI